MAELVSENEFPVRVKPLPARYTVEAENCVKTIPVDPTVTDPVVVIIQPLAALTVPLTTKI